MEFSLENMCRTCMNESDTMISVFSSENRGISKICYADMLMACAALNVAREDDLPQNICQHCLKHLSIAYSFKQQSERSEATLREITKNPDIEFIKTEIFDDNDSVDEIENENQTDTSEFKLTEVFLEDEFDADEDLAEEPERKIIKQEKTDFEALDTEFLEDEYILQYDESDRDQKTETALPESEEFLDDKILVQDEINVNPKREKFIYDLETLRKAVLKPKSPPTNDYKPNRLKKSILTSKSKNNRILPRELNCPYCDQTFRTQQAFKKHKKQHTKKLTCELCLKEFRSTHGLRYHMKIHNGIKNYACNFGDCTKRFRLKQALDKHLSIHNNEKNHLCPLCGKTYSTYDALHYHLKAHRGERPHLCIHCGKTFKQSCHLKSHMWVHSGVKPHVCSSCGKCYTSGHQLKKHVLKHCSPPAEAPPNEAQVAVEAVI